MSIANAFDSYYAKFVIADPDATFTFGNGPRPKPPMGSVDDIFPMFRSHYQEFVGYSVDDDAFFVNSSDRPLNRSLSKSGFSFYPAAKIGLAGAGGLAATAAVGLLMTADLSSSFASSELQYSLPTQDFVDDGLPAASLPEQQAIPSAPESIGLAPTTQTASSGRLVDQREIDRQMQELQELVDRLGVSSASETASLPVSTSQSAQPAASDQRLQPSSSSQIAQLGSASRADQPDVASQAQPTARNSSSESLPFPLSPASTPSSPVTGNSNLAPTQGQPQAQAQPTQTLEPTSRTANADDAKSREAIASLHEQPQQSNFVACVSPNTTAQASSGRVSDAVSASEQAMVLASSEADTIATEASPTCFTNTGSDFVISQAITVDRSSAALAEQSGNRQIQRRSAAPKADAQSSPCIQQLENPLSK